MLTAVFAMLAWASKSREQLLKDEIERVASTLSDPARVADLLDEIQLPDSWVRAELDAAVERWIGTAPSLPVGRHGNPVRTLREWLGFRQRRAVPLVFVAKKIGSADFSDILLTKALQGGLVAEAIVRTGDRRRHGYLLNQY